MKNLWNHASNIAEARDHFADHCATCTAMTAEENAINEGLYPPAPTCARH